jgi:hypothetical protein
MVSNGRPDSKVIEREKESVEWATSNTQGNTDRGWKKNLHESLHEGLHWKSDILVWSPFAS